MHSRLQLGELSSKPLILVTRVERSPLSIVVFALVVNTTNKNVNFTSMKLLDRRGIQFERSSHINWDLSDGTSPPGGVYGHWPAFLRNDGQEPDKLVYVTEEFGSIEVAAEEKMSNYGHWSTLSSSVQSKLEDELRDFSAMRWWGSVGSRDPLAAPTVNHTPPGYGY